MTAECMGIGVYLRLRSVRLRKLAAALAAALFIVIPLGLTVDASASRVTAGQLVLYAFEGSGLQRWPAVGLMAASWRSFACPAGACDVPAR